MSFAVKADPHGCGHLCQRIFIVQIDAALCSQIADTAIHRAGIQMRIAKRLGQPLGDRAFSGRARAVDGDIDLHLRILLPVAASRSLRR